MVGEVKVLLVEDQVMASETLKQIREFEILDVVSKAEKFVGCLDKHKSALDVIIMDLMLDTKTSPQGSMRFSGMELIREAIRMYPGLRIIVLSQFEYESVIVECYKAGAVGYLNKNAPLSVLVKSVSRISKGERMLPVDSEGKTSERLSLLCDPKLIRLKDHEIDFLVEFQQAEDTEELKDRLKYSDGYISNKISKIMKDVEFSSRFKLKNYLDSIVTEVRQS